MKTILTSPRPSGTIEAIPSKSHVHRLLICASLADKITIIKCPKTNNDIDATVHCLNELGAEITHDGTNFSVTPIKNIPSAAVLDCNESGSTFRFLLPLTAALGVNAKFKLSGRLPSRPLSPLYEELLRHGLTMSTQGSNPFEISGKLYGGIYSFTGDVSSQFTTGLLMALPLIDEESEIILSGKIESRPYINMTLDALGEFGVSPTESHGTWKIKSSSYVSPLSCSSEGDWSNAAFMLALGALSHSGVTVTALKEDSSQGDKAIVDILRDFGAVCSYGENSVTVRRGELCGIEIDAADIPDLVPILSVVASAARGTTVIKNCSRLRLKESDRLQSVSALINALGGDVKTETDSLIITGKGQLIGGTVSSFGDHRIAMSAAVASVICEKTVTINDSEVVSKSYPTFFEDFSLLCEKNSINSIL